ncbi:hypothetical protein FRC10_000769 [Ceratobasidium sp. 414]|nr:hypothetical protein FRC10_000769 [Ceratobasidium sp. 414]
MHGAAYNMLSRNPAPIQVLLQPLPLPSPLELLIRAMSISNNKSRAPTTSTPLIPVLRGSDLSHRSLFDRFVDIFASAGKVTVVCGAGISTHAGIPDFRSKDGLLRQTFGERSELKGSELFESRTLRDHEKRKIYSQVLTRMRVMARDVPVTNCHKLIAGLFDAGRLVRCYTQNIDDLQTRDREDMEGMVVELHGTNMYLKCFVCKQRPTQPASDFERHLAAQGARELCPDDTVGWARKEGLNDLAIAILVSANVFSTRLALGIVLVVAIHISLLEVGSWALAVILVDESSLDFDCLNSLDVLYDLRQGISTIRHAPWSLDVEDMEVFGSFCAVAIGYAQLADIV